MRRERERVRENRRSSLVLSCARRFIFCCWCTWHTRVTHSSFILWFSGEQKKGWDSFRRPPVSLSLSIISFSLSLKFFSPVFVEMALTPHFHFHFRFRFHFPSRRTGRKGGRGERRREAVVAGASFKTVGSALLVAEMSANFLQFAAHFPAIATDVLTRLGELLRVRACACVVGLFCSTFCFCVFLFPPSFFLFVFNIDTFCGSIPFSFFFFFRQSLHLFFCLSYLMCLFFLLMLRQQLQQNLSPKYIVPD